MAGGGGRDDSAEGDTPSDTGNVGNTGRIRPSADIVGIGAVKSGTDTKHLLQQYTAGTVVSDNGGKGGKIPFQKSGSYWKRGAGAKVKHSNAYCCELVQIVCKLVARAISV